MSGEAKKKKILAGYIMDGHSGGIDSYLLTFLQQIWQPGMQIDFLSDRKDRELERAVEKYGTRIYQVSSLWHAFRQYRETRKIIEENGYDEVYLNISTAMDFIGAKAARDCGVKEVILHSHSSGNDCENAVRRHVYNGLHKICRLFFHRYGTRHCACSKAAGRWMYPEKIMEAPSFEVIHNAVDRKKFAYDSAVREEVRRELGIENKFVLGHAGNFCYQKNHAFLLDVFEEVLKINKEAVLVLAGDGVRFEAMKKRAGEKGIEKSILFLGRRSDIPRLYQAMDVFVLPSNFEGLPIAGIEAQSSGLPCFMSDRITQEAKITSECAFLSFQTGAAGWAREIVKKSGERRAAEYLENAGMYDIERQKEELRALV